MLILNCRYQIKTDTNLHKSCRAHLNLKRHIWNLLLDNKLDHKRPNNEGRGELTRKCMCSDPSYESDPSNEYSPLGLTDVMNSIFLDPSNEFFTQAVNIGIPKQTLGLCFHVSKCSHKISYQYHGRGCTGDC